MKPFEKILVPLDFSAESGEVIRTAADVSGHYHAPVTLLHVFHPIAYVLPEGFVAYPPAELTGMLSGFESMLASSKKDAEAAGAHHVETRLLQGVPASEIVDFARRGGFDLIVMGTHGRTGLQHAVIGSIAEKVVRSALCPVLTVRRSARAPDGGEQTSAG